MDRKKLSKSERDARLSRIKGVTEFASVIDEAQRMYEAGVDHPHEIRRLNGMVDDLGNLADKYAKESDDRRKVDELDHWQRQFLYYALPADTIEVETLDGTRHTIRGNGPDPGPAPLDPENAASWAAELADRLNEHSFDWNMQADWAICADCGCVATGDTMALIPIKCAVPIYSPGYPIYSQQFPSTSPHIDPLSHPLCPCGRGHRMICQTHGPDAGP